MYYYKTRYTDNTWAQVATKVPITDPQKEVCSTCYSVERKSWFWYWKYALLDIISTFFYCLPYILFKRKEVNNNET